MVSFQKHLEAFKNNFPERQIKFRNLLINKRELEAILRKRAIEKKGVTRQQLNDLLDVLGNDGILRDASNIKKEHLRRLALKNKKSLEYLSKTLATIRPHIGNCPAELEELFNFCLYDSVKLSEAYGQLVIIYAEQWNILKNLPNPPGGFYYMSDMAEYFGKVDFEKYILEQIIKYQKRYAAYIEKFKELTDAVTARSNVPISLVSSLQFIVAMGFVVIGGSVGVIGTKEGSEILSGLGGILLFMSGFSLMITREIASQVTNDNKILLMSMGDILKQFSYASEK